MRIYQQHADYRTGRSSITYKGNDIFENPLPRDLDDFWHAGILVDVNCQTNDPITGIKHEKRTSKTWNTKLTLDSLNIMNPSLMLAQLNALEKVFTGPNIVLLNESIPESRNKCSSVKLTPNLMNLHGKVFGVQGYVSALEMMEHILQGKETHGSVAYRVAAIKNPRPAIVHQSQLGWNSELFPEQSYGCFIDIGIIPSHERINNVTECMIQPELAKALYFPHHYVYRGTKTQDTINQIKCNPIYNYPQQLKDAAEKLRSTLDALKTND